MEILWLHENFTSAEKMNVNDGKMRAKEQVVKNKKNLATLNG